MRPLMLITAKVTGDQTSVNIGVHDIDLPDGRTLVAEFNERVVIRPPDELLEVDKWASALLRIVAADVELTRMRRTALSLGSLGAIFTPHRRTHDGAPEGRSGHEKA